MFVYSNGTSASPLSAMIINKGNTASLDIGSVTISAGIDTLNITSGDANLTVNQPYSSGGAITDTADSTYSSNEETMLGNLKTLVNNIRTALIANKIMS